MIDDYSHRITAKIDLYGQREGFPSMSAFGFDKERFDEYLFDKQAILDSRGSARKQYTIAGTLMVIPVIILSAFPENMLPWKQYSLYVGLLMGLVLYGLYAVVAYGVRKLQLRRMRDEQIERFIEAVENWQDNKINP